MKKISIIVLHYNGEKNTIVCLKSIKNLVAHDVIILPMVVDNASQKKFVASSVKVLRSEENLGFAGGNNIGIKNSLEQKSDYILILNNDTVVDENLIKELLVVMERDERIGIVSPKIYFEKGHEYHKTRYHSSELGKVIWYAGGIMDHKNIIGSHRGVDEVDHGQFDRLEETDFATGCCMLVRKEVFREIGFLDEKYFLYYEDNDFCRRAWKAGFKIMYAPKAIIWHKNAGSAGGSGSNLQDYYITRNRLLYGIRYESFRSKLSLLRESVKFLFNGRYWQKRGVLDFYRGAFKKGSYFL